jgi:hypothetical protein
MKHIKLFEELFEVSKDKNIKITKLRNEVMKIADDTEAQDGPKWTEDFIENLKKSGYEIFQGDLKDFVPADLDSSWGLKNILETMSIYSLME